MQLTQNTILITGGGTGIGRGLAEALHHRGNRVVIAGRRRDALEAVVGANPGMGWVELDLRNPAGIAAAAAEVVARYPDLNVLINNAGVMQYDDVARPIDEGLLVSTLTTNLMGPIRLTGQLVAHLRGRDRSAIVNVSSVLGFVPFAPTAVYSASKAAIHSYTLSLRHRLRGTSVKVVEVLPPWVRTDLLNSRDEPRAMPLADFVREAMALLGTDADEIVVDRARPLRDNPGPGEGAFVEQFNDAAAAGR